MLELNKIHQGHVLKLLKQIDDESIDECITSPPYYGLRSYKTEPQIWLNGKDDCGKHEWITETIIKNGGKNHPERPPNVGANKHIDSTDLRGKGIKSNICKNCGAYYGELGLEPTFELYLNHLWQIFDEIYRVLKKTGSCWVNLGDSYGGSWSNYGAREGNQRVSKTERYSRRGEMPETWLPPARNYQPKSLLQIPSRFSIGMSSPNWELRDDLTKEERDYVYSELIKRGII